MPNHDDSPFPTDPRKALLTLRILWASILIGLLVFLGVVLVVKAEPSRDADLKSMHDLLFYINCGMLFVGLFVGYTLRNQFYKRHWEGEVVTPQGYTNGNLVLWAIAEGCGFFSLTIVLISGTMTPYIWPAVGAAASIVINFPNGRIMFPSYDSIG